MSSASAEPRVRQASGKLDYDGAIPICHRHADRQGAHVGPSDASRPHGAAPCRRAPSTALRCQPQPGDPAAVSTTTSAYAALGLTWRWPTPRRRWRITIARSNDRTRALLVAATGALATMLRFDRAAPAPLLPRRCVFLADDRPAIGLWLVLLLSMHRISPLQIFVPGYACSACTG